MHSFYQHQSSDPKLEKQKLPSFWGFFLWLTIFLVFLSFWPNLSDSSFKEISYSSFKDRVRKGDVIRVVIYGDQIEGFYRDFGGEQLGLGRVTFKTIIPSVGDESLVQLMEQHGVEVNAKSEKQGWWIQIFAGILPWVLILGIFWYTSIKLQERNSGTGSSGLFNFTKSKARHLARGETKNDFNDVAGLESVKKNLSEITSYLKEPERYRKLGAKIPKGFLLMGPLGTGKTLLARAVAGEAQASIFSISGSEFIEMYAGVGASRVRDMFASAKTDAPAIIYIDEIDSVGRARGTGVGGGHDEREQTLNQILGEMDGFETSQAVVVLAATNRPDVLDTALLRLGRFDRKITFDLPDKKSRRAILRLHSQQVPLADDVDLEHVAALTIGFSGADLENLVSEAALRAEHQFTENVDMSILTFARDKIVMGSKREIVIGEQEKELIAYHEAGHALLANLLPNADPLDKVTLHSAWQGIRSY